MIRSVIAFGIQAAGCLYAGYWAIFFGSVAFLIITSLPAGAQASSSGKDRPHEPSITTTKAPKRGKATSD